MSGEAGKGDGYRPVNREAWDRNWLGIDWSDTRKAETTESKEGGKPDGV